MRDYLPPTDLKDAADKMHQAYDPVHKKTPSERTDMQNVVSDQPDYFRRFHFRTLFMSEI